VLQSGDKVTAARIAARFPTRFLRSYVYWKLRTDPVYLTVSGSLAEAGGLPLLDLGCGAGVLAAYLRELGFRGPVHGVDLDEEKIAVARSVAAFLDGGAQFKCMDFRDVRDARQGHVTMLDVLIYMTDATQREVLARAASFVHTTDGVLIVRTGIGDGGWRHGITRWADLAAGLVRWMKVRPVHYPPLEMFREVLEPLGFEVECRPLWGRTPFNNHVIIARNKR